MALPDDRSTVHARRVGTAVGALVGLGIGVAASILVGAAIYAVNGEEHAVGAGIWVGVGLFIGTPIAMILGAIAGRRIAERRVGKARGVESIPLRPD